MASWVTDWAEKGGHLLNSLDIHVASLLKGDATEAANGVPAPSGPSLRADTPPGDSEDPPMLNSNSKELYVFHFCFLHDFVSFF